MNKDTGWWKRSYLWSLSAPIETSRMASARVNGRSLFASMMGSKILFRKALRV